MFKITSTKFNLIFVLINVLCYNHIFVKTIYNINPSIWFVLGFMSVVFMILFIFSSILFNKYTTKPFAIFIFMTNAICLYFMASFNASIDKVMLTNVLATDASEASDLINLKFLFFVIFLGFLPSYLVYKINIEYSTFIKELGKKVLAIIIAIAIGLAIALPNSKNVAQFLRNNRDVKGVLLPVNYFSAIIGVIKIKLKSQKEFVNIAPDAKMVKYWKNNKPNLFFVVVGETARAKNFSLSGYERDTNSALDRFNKDIYYFSNASSCGTATAVSLPCMFLKSGRDDFKMGSGAYTENVLDVINRSDYKVIWRENNSGCQGLCNRIETQKFCDGYKCKDEILLKDIDEKLAQSKNENILFVMHQQGSHGPAYYKRYPKEFEQFKPTCNTKNLDKCSVEEVVNTYDNTIAYTSHVVAKMIDKLKLLSKDYNVALIYASDHGESLGEKGLYLHSAPYIIAPDEQTQIPMLVWLDDANAKSLNIDTKCLQKKLSDQHSHDNLFHSLLGLTGVKTNDYNKDLDIFQNCRT